MRALTFALMLFGLLCVYIGLWAWLPFVSKDMRLDLVGVVVFVLTGSLIYLAGSWLERKLPPERTRVFVLKRNEIGFITKMLDRERRMYLVFGLVLLAVDALVIAAIAYGNESEPAHPVIAMVLGIATMLFLAGVAVLFLYRSFTLRNAKRTRIHDVLTKTPHLVTGLTVYFIQKEHAPGTLGRNIMVELRVGTEKLRLGVVSEEHFSLLKQHVQLHSPHASYQEQEQKV